MAHSEQPLYPKLSSIYNKIMQLAIAIVLIVVLLNILLFNQQKNHRTIEQHFSSLGQEYSQQAAHAISVLFAKNDKAGLQAYIDQLASSSAIRAVHFYDLTGQLLFHSDSAKTMQALYGIEQHQINHSDIYIPFVQNVKNEHLQGYLRLTIAKAELVKNLQKVNESSAEMFRIMLVVAGLIGFLLTRGLNRFSRQGYRINKTPPAKQA